ncbi:hypothetical protein ScPMuIL_017327 [Solemya velum]
MPPKAKKNEPSKKTETKKKEKVIEDKTFGLKNKKGSKQQKFIQHVTKQVKFGNVKASKAQELEKDKKKVEKDELNTLFKPVQQTVSKGVDPKSVVCAFFKQGQCSKGDKCKFSHDLNVGRKGEKRSVYSDVRGEDEKEDNMEDWDEAKLEEVVNKKHGDEENTKPKTNIICKFFLEAVENSKYGWFWQCPNGGDKCMYKHALPPGFMLKKDQKKTDKIDEISLEELIEKERASLGGSTTRVTLESFLKWKERKKREKKQAIVAEHEKKKADYIAGRMLGISGRELFEFNPELMDGDDDEAGEIVREKEEDDEDETAVIDIDMDNLASQAREDDGTGTRESSRVLGAGDSNSITVNGDNLTDDEKLSEAAALPVQTANEINTDEVLAASLAATMNGEDIQIDEDLFDGEDIDQIDEDLETLELDSDGE